MTRLSTVAAALGFSAAIGIATSSFAADLSQTVFGVESHRMTAGGSLDACFLQFDSTYRDTGYRLGRPTYAGGSIGFWKNGSLVLKLVVLDPSSDGPVKTSPKPELAYLELKDHRNNSASLALKHDSDDGRGRLFVYPIDDIAAQALAEIADRKSITVGFNRAPGGMDVHVPLDLTIIKFDDDQNPVHSTAEVDDFVGCMAQLAPLIGKPKP